MDQTMGVPTAHHRFARHSRRVRQYGGSPMKSFRFILSFLLLFITAEALRADWPNFRGPNGPCFSTETNVPITLGAPSNPPWRADLPGEGLSSPVIIGSRL